jgi:hypothetical protein
VQNLSAASRALLLSQSAQELDTWNSFTRRTTRESLQAESMPHK